MKILPTATGLGLRREFIDELCRQEVTAIDFLELAPENWLAMGGRFAKQLAILAQRYPFICHGLSLSLGGPHPLNIPLLQQIKDFLERYQIELYSEHLSYSADDGQLYDLLPIPFTEEAVFYVSDRIRQAQDILQRKIALENISYYYAPGKQMDEIDFINAVISEAQCELLVDINNIYVNSVNHCYDPYQFIDRLPTEQIRYLHIAGHFQQSPNLLIDSHGNDVPHPVWQLLKYVYQKFSIVPTLLERDHRIPSLDELCLELQHIKKIQQAVLQNVELPL